MVLTLKIHPRPQKQDFGQIGIPSSSPSLVKRDKGSFSFSTRTLFRIIIKCDTIAYKINA